MRSRDLSWIDVFAEDVANHFGPAGFAVHVEGEGGMVVAGHVVDDNVGLGGEGLEELGQAVERGNIGNSASNSLRRKVCVITMNPQRVLDPSKAACKLPVILMEDLIRILDRLESCVSRETYESLETDWLEVKPVPATGNAWDSIRESVCAYLNTRGGVVLLGIKDEQKPKRRYVFNGYTEDQSGQLSELRKHFKDARSNPVDVSEHVRFEVRP